MGFLRAWLSVNQGFCGQVTIQENDDESKDLYAANPAGSTLKYARANGRGHNLSEDNNRKNDCQNQPNLVPIKVIHCAI